MLLRFLCVFFFIQLSCVLDASASYWDAELVKSYAHRSELQRRWAWSFLAPYLKSLNGDEHILDIGCGDGKITADISRFVNKGFVIGIDPSIPMLEWARKQYHVSEYSNLAFQEGSFLKPNLLGPFDLIVSFCAMQHCSDQQAAIHKLSQLLKTGGRLLILVPAMQNLSLNAARARVQSRDRWEVYWRNFVPRKFLSAEQYSELLKSAGFDVIKTEIVKTMDPFVDRNELLDWMEGTFAPVVPREYAREFYNEWIEEYLHLNPEAINSEGVIYAQLGYLTIDAYVSAEF